MGVNGVLNSWDTIETNSDFILSSFFNLTFAFIISSYKIALLKGAKIWWIIDWKQVTSSFVNLFFLKISITPSNLSLIITGAIKESYSLNESSKYSFLYDGLTFWIVSILNLDNLKLVTPTSFAPNKSLLIKLELNSSVVF